MSTIKKIRKTSKTLTPKKVMEGIDKLRKAQEATDKFIKELGKGSDERMKATDKFIKELGKDTDKKMQDRDERMKATDERIEELSKQIGGIHKTNGKLAEVFFYEALNDNPTIDNRKYTKIYHNIKLKNGKEVIDEFDIVLINGTSVVIVEVKQKAAIDDIQKLKIKKLKNFRQGNPEYNTHKIYLALAGFIIPKDVEQFAKKNGIAILKRKGKMIENTNNNLKAY